MSEHAIHQEVVFSATPHALRSADGLGTALGDPGGRCPAVPSSVVAPNEEEQQKEHEQAVSTQRTRR